MKRNILLAASIAAIAVTAACSGGGGGGAAQRQPGEWETVTTIKAMEVPGAPAEMQAQIRSQVGQAQTTRECLSEQDARDPLQKMRTMITQGPSANCQFSDQVFAGGTIRIRANCPAPGGQGSAEVALEGTFTETTLQASMNVNAQGAGVAPIPGATGMRMTAEMRGRRVGDCPAGGARPAPAAPANTQ